MQCPQCQSEINLDPGGITNCNIPWKAGTLNCWRMRPMSEFICNKCNMKYKTMAEYETHVCSYWHPQTRDPLLTERQKTHGDFKTNALISQTLKDVFDRHSDGLIATHREALDMIALKLSRILSGQANFKDHWDDIAGYAKLGSEACD